jgi:hypothetical protein
VDTYNKFPLFISTEETTIGLYSNQCTHCYVNLKYFDEDSANFDTPSGLAAKDALDTEIVAIYDKSDYELQKLTFGGKYASDKFSFELAKYGR